VDNLTGSLTIARYPWPLPQEEKKICRDSQTAKPPLSCQCQQSLTLLSPLMAYPVPWSLAWSDDGELAAQDRFDLLQTLVACESESIQPTLIALIESMPLHQVAVLSTSDVTGQWA